MLLGMLYAHQNTPASVRALVMRYATHLVEHQDDYDRDVDSDGEEDDVGDHRALAAAGDGNVALLLVAASRVPGAMAWDPYYADVPQWLVRDAHDVLGRAHTQ